MDFTNSKAKSGLAALIVVATAASYASAEPLYSGGDWVVGLNATKVLTGESLHATTVAGVPVPHADVAITDDMTLTFDVSYFVSPSFAVNFYSGIPAKASLTGEGSLAGLPVGETKYGPAILSLQYHIFSIGGLSPYVGVGVGRVVFLDEKDGALINFNLTDAWSPALQAGFRYRLNENWLANIDVRYVPFKSDVSGWLGGAPVNASVEVDPVLVNVGVAYRF
ncbi:OmpW/AlkL family protein [Xanthobacter sediminis]